MVPGDNEAVRRYWEDEACGIRYGQGADAESAYRAMERTRYVLEPYVPEFAEFENYKGKEILELGVGAGTDFSQFIRGGAIATGVDLTDTAIEHTARRLQLAGYAEDAFRLQRADVEDLPFPDNSFDLVYSWGVLHHTAAPEKALVEAHRVLRPGAPLRAMIYHARSWASWMLWARHALLRGRPWVSPRRCVFEHLESPGTKVYTRAAVKRMVEKAGFSDVTVRAVLGPGDLLKIKPSRKYQGPIYRIVWALYPRWLVRLLGDSFGLYLLISAAKPLNQVPVG